MQKNSENNRTVEIGLVTPTPGLLWHNSRRKALRIVVVI